MKLHTLPIALAMLAVSSTAPAEEKKTSDIVQITITIQAAKEDFVNVPIRMPLSVPKISDKLKVVKVARLLDGGTYEPLLGQLTIPGLVTENIPASDNNLVRRDLHFVTSLKAGQPGIFVVPLSDFSGRLHSKFAWGSKSKDWTELDLVGPKGTQRPVLRYMHKAYDPSTPENRNQSYKVFHHLYDPDGKRFVTNGGHTDPYTDAKKLLYPHHRGLGIGFNRITYGNGKKADTWHCPKEYVSHVKFLETEAGPVLGRHRVLVNWMGKENDLFAKEEREMTVYNVPGGTLVEFADRLKTTGGKIKLDGDPQHAGFQFRAANDVAEKTAKETYYLRPDGKGKPGATRNWPEDKANVNLPWNAMSFVLDGKRFTVCYLDNPNNPGEKRHSERDYGRFGCYFEFEVTENHPLVLNHRVWLQKGEMTGEQVQALSGAFAMPPAVAVK